MIPGMAERDPSPNGAERDVLGSLPRARPTRRSSKRGAPAGPATSAPEQAAATRSQAPPTTRATKPRRQAPKRAAAAKRPRLPPARPIPPAGYATPSGESGDRGEHPGLLVTVVLATGELAHLGLAAGRQALKGTLGRLPRP